MTNDRMNDSIDSAMLDGVTTNEAYFFTHRFSSTMLCTQSTGPTTVRHSSLKQVLYTANTLHTHTR